jgi:Ca2+-binding EF-hand superfamily protein
MPEQFRERAKQFDKNNDGMIDTDERREMFRSMRGGGGGGGGDQPTT